MEVPQIQFIDSVEDTLVWQERQVPWRYSLVEVPQFLRGRLHSTVSAAHSLLTGVRAESYGQIVDVPTPQIPSACFGAGRWTDRRSGSAPDLRVQALPTVAHRPSESVLLRFTELFHPLSSIGYFFHTGTGRTLFQYDVPICGPWANTTSQHRRRF